MEQSICDTRTRTVIILSLSNTLQAENYYNNFNLTYLISQLYFWTCLWFKSKTILLYLKSIWVRNSDRAWIYSILHMALVKVTWFGNLIKIKQVLKTHRGFTHILITLVGMAERLALIIPFHPLHSLSTCPKTL